MSFENKLRQIVILGLFSISTFLIQSARAADCPTAASESSPVAAAPSRPNFANAADILQQGVVEFEDGYSRSFIAPESSQTDVPALLRFAPTCNLELRYGSDSLMSVQNEGHNTIGFGDSWITGQYQFLRQSGTFTPSLAVSYGLKVPLASGAKGLGTGQYDHAFTFLVDRNVRTTVLTFNVTYTFVGVPGGLGFQKNAFLAGNFARPLLGPVGITGEFYGATRLNVSTRGYEGTLWALTYTVNRRLVLDSGVDCGVTPGEPHLRVYAGVSYALATPYPLF